MMLVVFTFVGVDVFTAVDVVDVVVVDVILLLKIQPEQNEELRSYFRSE